MVAELLQGRAVTRLELLIALRVVLQQIEAGQSRGTAQRIGGEAVAVEEGVGRGVADEAPVEPFAGHRHPHGQEAAGEPLGEGHQIGLNPGPLAGEQGTGAAEAGHHLIGDQQGATGLNPLCHCPQKTRAHQAHAGGPLDQRLNDQGRRGGSQGLLQLLQGRGLPLLNIPIPPMGVGPGDAGHVEQQLVVGGGEDGAIPQGHGSEGVTVIRPLKGDQLAPLTALVAPPLPGDLEGHLHRGGAVVGEEQPLQAGEGAQSRRQRLRRGMAEVGEDHLLQLQGLAPDGGGDARFAVAMQGHPPAADGVDQLAAVLQLQQAAAGAHHPQGLRGHRHLGGGVPEVGMPAHGVPLSRRVCTGPSSSALAWSSESNSPVAGGRSVPGVRRP